MLSLTQLEVFVAVVESGGFSGAAKRLYMSQPSVSNHVRNLESSLGVRLVQRSSQGARPTPAGELVAAYAGRIFEQLASLEQEVASHRDLGAGRLVVAGTTTLATHLLPRLIADFTASAPNVDCQIRAGNHDLVEHWILRGEVGVGLCIGPAREEQLVVEPLLEEDMVLVAAPESPLVGRELRPSDLAGERFLMREMGSATRRQQEAVLQDWDLSTVAQWDLWGADTIKEAVQAGLGVALLSQHATVREVESGLLSRLTVTPAPPARTVSLMYRADRVLTPPEDSFVRLLRGLTSWPT